MEALKEQESAAGLLHDILPPRLEDAGLEDCALPPDLIKEAFFKAASSVKSRATSIFGAEEEEEPASCVQDPCPKTEEPPTDKVVGVPPVPNLGDKLVGLDVERGAPGSCVVEKGGGVVEEGRDKVVVVGDDDLDERENGKGGCLGDGFKEQGGQRKEEEGEDRDGGERPILTEGYPLRSLGFVARAAALMGMIRVQTRAEEATSTGERSTHSTIEEVGSDYVVRIFNQKDQFGYSHVWLEMKVDWKIVAGSIIGFFGAACGSVGGGGVIFVPMLSLLFSKAKNVYQAAE